MTAVVHRGLIGKGGTNVSGVDTTLTIWGLFHLTNDIVSVCLGALDLGDFTVAADGSVTVSLLATAGQPNAWSAIQLLNMNADYGESTTLIQVNSGAGATFANVPCVVGSAYTTQGQRLRLITVQDAKTPTGPVLATVRRSQMWGALLQNAIQISFGTSFTPGTVGNMDPWDTIDPVTGDALVAGVAYSGVVTGILEDGHSYDSMLCWQVNRPYPATVVSISSFLQTHERK
jgi:hypothetical protein